MAVGQIGTSASSSAKSLYTQEFTAADANLGGNWKAGATVANIQWRDITYANSLYMAVGINQFTGQPLVYRSPDGVTWTDVTPAGIAGIGLNAVAYGNGTWVVLARDTAVNYYSTNNGTSWTSGLMPASNDGWSDIAWHSGGGLFIALCGQSAATNVYATSPDGVTWTGRTFTTSLVYSSVASNGTNVVVIAGVSKDSAASSTSTVALSGTTGTSWTTRTLSSSQIWSALAYGNGRFVAIPGNSQAAGSFSTDGTTWTAFSLPAVTPASYSALTWTGDRFIAVAGIANTTKVFYSTTGATSSWAPAVLSSSDRWYAVAGNTSNAVAGSATNTYSQLAISTAATNTWTCPAGVSTVDVLAVGGGGGGGGGVASFQNGGGGGGGQVLRKRVSVSAGTTYPITIGAFGPGGAAGGGTGINGGLTSFGTLLIAFGGGGGGAAGSAGLDGGSGGGASSGGTGSAGSGGGGGAGGAGQQAVFIGTAFGALLAGGNGVGSGTSGGGFGANNASGGGNGGPGLYGYGGGGGGYSTGPGGAGADGGGRGGAPGADALVNTGSGGGGGGGSNAGGNGGAGYLALEWWA